MKVLFAVGNEKISEAIIKEYQKQIEPGGSLILDASQSVDPEGEALTFYWSIIKKPATK